jgi:hypothetical protein
MRSLSKKASLVAGAFTVVLIVWNVVCWSFPQWMLIRPNIAYKPVPPGAYNEFPTQAAVVLNHSDMLNDTTELWNIFKAKIASMDAPTFQNHSDSRIPRIVHFIFGLSPDFGGKPFGLMHYVAVKSAYRMLHPSQMFLYYTYEPKGFWWELAKPMLTLEWLPEITEIFGRPVAHVAHRADVIRLQKLIERGGIYHDLDVVTLRDYPEVWFNEEFVMAQQGDGAHFGLCNAIMMSSKQAWFAKLWLEQYQNFDGGEWDKFSVRLPKYLWIQYPESIKVLSSRRMFWPLFSKSAIKKVFEQDTYKWQDRYDQVAYHAWEKMTYGTYLSTLKAEKVFQQDTAFHRMIRPSLVEVMNLIDEFSILQDFQG